MFSSNGIEVVKKVLRPLHAKLKNHRYRNGTIELRNVKLKFDPREEYLDYGSDIASREYIEAELAWYNSQDPYITGHKIIQSNTIWQSCASYNGRVNSNYGNLVYSKENGQQFLYAVKALEKDRYSRRSVIIYNRPQMHEQAFDDYHAKNDFICTMYTQQFIEDDNTFTMIVNMRSNDVFFGLRNDYSWQRHIYFIMYHQLQETFPALKIGNIIWNAGSMHIYERHYDKLVSIMEEWKHGKV